jgi:glycosyltransferase involved in cell wall biosynthesis
MRKIAHQLILKMSSATIEVSDVVANELKNLTKNKNKIITIYNPCFLMDDIYEKKYEFVDKKIKLVAAGRLSYQKGFDILIESYKSLPESIKQVTTLTIYGEGDLNYKTHLEKLISGENRITLAGKSDNLINILRNYDIFILSSRYEGFGNVLAEALAADCFCISFDIAHGPREILKNGDYGALIEKYSIKSLSDTIFDVITEKKYKNRDYSSGDRKEHLKKFTPNYFSKEIAKLLKRFKKIN